MQPVVDRRDVRSIEPVRAELPPALGELALVLSTPHARGAVLLSEDETFWRLELVDGALRCEPLRQPDVVFPCIGRVEAVEPGGPAAQASYLQGRRVVSLDLRTQRGRTAVITEGLEQTGLRGAWLDPRGHALIVEVLDTSELYRHGVAHHYLREVRLDPPTELEPVEPGPGGGSAAPGGRPESVTDGREDDVARAPGSGEREDELAGAPESGRDGREDGLAVAHADDEREDPDDWEALVEELDDWLDEEQLDDEPALDPELDRVLLELELTNRPGGAPVTSPQLRLDADADGGFAWHAGGGILVVIRDSEVTAWRSLGHPIEHPLADALTGFTRGGARIEALRLHPRLDRAVFCVRWAGPGAALPRRELWCADWHEGPHAALWRLGDGHDEPVQLGNFDPHGDFVDYRLRTRGAERRYVQWVTSPSAVLELEAATGSSLWIHDQATSSRSLVSLELGSRVITRWPIDPPRDAGRIAERGARRD